VKPFVVPTLNSIWAYFSEDVFITVVSVITESPDPETFVIGYIFHVDDDGLHTMPLPEFLRKWRPISENATEPSNYEPPKGRSVWERLMEDDDG
jgi:hypothetical protein